MILHQTSLGVHEVCCLLTVRKGADILSGLPVPLRGGGGGGGVTKLFKSKAAFSQTPPFSHIVYKYMYITPS